jgi:hypothetical protein
MPDFVPHTLKRVADTLSISQCFIAFHCCSAHNLTVALRARTAGRRREEPVLGSLGRGQSWKNRLLRVKTS